MPLFIGPRWATYSTKYFDGLTWKNQYVDPIYSTQQQVEQIFCRSGPASRLARPATARRRGRLAPPSGRVAAVCDHLAACPCRSRRLGRRFGVRFILRRLVFYVIAFWAAITLNFLLPRLMPGSPLDGLISATARRSRTTPTSSPAEGSLGSADEPIWRAYPTYLATSSPATSACRPRSRCR